MQTIGSRGSYMGLDSLWPSTPTLAFISWPYNFQPSLAFTSYLPMELPLVQVSQGDIWSLYRQNFQDSSCLHGQCNVKGPNTYETVLGMVCFTHLCFHPQLALVPYALGLEDQHFGSFHKIQGSIDCWEHLNNVNWVLQWVKKAGGTFSGWKLDSVYWKLWQLAIAALIKDIILRIARFRKYCIGPTAIVSPRSKVSWCMQYCPIWVKDLQASEAPGYSNKERHGFCLGSRSEIIHGGAEAKNCPAPYLVPLTITPLMHHSCNQLFW